MSDVPAAPTAQAIQSVAVNHRSPNSEIIARLEAQVLTRRAHAQDQLAACRATRERLAAVGFDPADIDRFKREVRP